MLEGTYRFTASTPLGSKDGTVALHTDGKKVIGVVDAPVLGRQHIEGRLEGDNSFSAAGTFKLMLVGKVNYALQGEVQGDSLRVAIRSSKGSFEITGSRMR